MPEIQQHMNTRAETGNYYSKCFFIHTRLGTAYFKNESFTNKPFFLKIKVVTIQFPQNFYIESIKEQRVNKQGCEYNQMLNANFH